MVAIVGSVKRAQSNKRTHQSLQNVELLKPVTKKTLPVVVEDQVAEIMLEAFRAAVSYPQGATAVSLPIDIMTPGKSKSAIRAFPPAAFTPPAYGLSSDASLSQAVKMIENAKFPVLFLGMRAASNAVVDQVHALLRKHPLPVVETFQVSSHVQSFFFFFFCAGLPTGRLMRRTTRTRTKEVLWFYRLLVPSPETWPTSSLAA